ncbi:MAG: hypothetical protein HYT16_04525 [DPANN group archaeon]|nr:hypothetical protein [DPANN group archaeon]
MKAQIKKEASKNILARALLGRKMPASMKEKTAAPRSILERAFNKQSGLEQASHEGLNKWFKNLVEEQFKRWHKHSDGSPAKPVVLGSYGEDLEKSDSGLERAVAKTASAGEPAVGYVAKGGAAKKEDSEKKDTDKFRSSDASPPRGSGDIKDAYKAGSKGGDSYKSGAAGASYKAGGDAHVSGTSYASQAAGAVVSCASCGTGAHAEMNSDGTVSFNSMGKMGSNMYQIGGSNSLYGAGGQNKNYQSGSGSYAAAPGGNVQSTNYQQQPGGDDD